MDDMRTPQWGIGPPRDNEVSGLTIEDSHRYAMWDAAYVLGSLSASDRREFEAHMANCPACREAVADLSGVPALLSQLDRAEVAAMNGRTAESLPETPALSPELLPSLLATVRWRRRRTRVATWVASSAAAAGLGVGVLVGVQGYSSMPAQPVTASQPMAQISTSMLTSTVQLVGQHRGTSINLKG